MVNAYGGPPPEAQAAAGMKPGFGPAQQGTGGGESVYSFERMAEYTFLGVLAGAALATILRRSNRGPKNLLDGAHAVLEAGAASVDGYAQAEYTTDLLTLFGPAIIAAGVATAVQLARRFGQARPS
jgi:hypothetical protein